MNGFPHKQIKVFVASSSKSVGVAEALKEALSNEEIVVIPWKELGVFLLSEHTIESLEKAANQCQFAAFVLGPDDVIQTETEGVYVPRDNVVFELGLFLGRIGRRRSYMLKPHGVNVKLPSDLSGITWAEYTLLDNNTVDVEDASIQIRHAMQHAPMTPTINLLSATVFPQIVIRNALNTFQEYLQKPFKFFRKPHFKCDAQVTVCTHNGRILHHSRISSVGQSVTSHEGKTLWANFPFSQDTWPLQVLLDNKDHNGWVVWSDSGYSQMYIPIAARHNHRISVAHSRWNIGKRIYLLEVHQELATEIDSSSLQELAHIIGQRILQEDNS